MIVDVYPLTPMQEGMLFHGAFAMDDQLYLEQLGIGLSGQLDPDLLLQAWSHVCQRHPILRTLFVEDEGEALQVVRESHEIDWRFLDWQNFDAKRQEQELRGLQHRERITPFKFDEEPPLRFVLVQLGPTRFHFLWTHHHVLLDGWSLPILMEEVQRCYAALCHDEKPRLGQVFEYGRYLSWLEDQNLLHAKAFWRDLLTGFSEPNKLPTVGGHVARDKEKAVFLKEWSESDTQTLEAFAQANGLTLNTLFQGAWGLLLSRYCHSRDVVFGVTVSGRPTDLPDANRMVGLFINTLPLRLGMDASASLQPWLHAIQDQQLEARQFEYVSLVEIQAQSDVMAGESLFESLLVFENYPTGGMNGSEWLGTSILDVMVHEKTHFPLVLQVAADACVSLKVTFDLDRFDAPFCQGLLAQLKHLLDCMVAEPQTRLGALELLKGDARLQVVSDWNQTQKAYLREAVFRCFEASVDRRPQAVALQNGETEMTYAMLDEAANRLAHYLSEQQLGPNPIIGIYLPSSFDFFTAMLGILKAGGAFLPLDTSYPEQRLRYMLADSGAQVLITRAGLLSFDPEATQVLDIDTAPWLEAPGRRLHQKVCSQALAYLMYTSGTTGQPKGTMITHQNIMALLSDHDYISISEGDGFAQVSNVSFDALTFEVWTAFANGGRLCLVDRDYFLEVDKFGEAIAKHGIDSLFITTSLFCQFAEGKPDVFRGMKNVIFGGEVVHPSAIEKVLAAGGPDRLVHAYGPTESTTFATCHQISQSHQDAVSIGRPLVNTTAYVLDGQGHPLPPWITGELYLGSEGLARGYHRRPGWTADRFVPDPFTSVPGARLYRTGDLVHADRQGQIFFVGRTDHQVKVRGFRIELGEIERALLNLDLVLRAKVGLMGEHALEKRLVAWVQGSEGNKLFSANLRRDLANQLPEYMIPQAFVFLDAFPLTPNGKIDLRALEAAASQAIRQGDQELLEKPLTPTEQVLESIWCKVLDRNALARDANFFELGGHSLLAVRVISRIRDTFDLDIPLATIFKHATIRALADFIDQRNRESSMGAEPAMLQVPRHRSLPLSFAQERLWFLDQLDPGLAIYNMPVAFQLNGCLDVAVLHACLDEIVARHESLRTHFPKEAEKTFQKIEPLRPCPLDEIDLSDVPEADREKQAHRHFGEEVNRSFNLADGPLFRALLIRLKQDRSWLMLNMHHIIADGWSIRIMMDEFQCLYPAFAQGMGSPLLPLPIQYADFAVWQRAWLHEERLNAELDWWRKYLEDVPFTLDLPLDHSRPPLQTHHGRNIPFSVPADLTQAILDLCRDEGVTLFMFVEAAFAILLARYSGQADFCIGTPVASRNRTQIEPIIGFFVNALVLRLQVDGNVSFADFLMKIREDTLAAYTHQDVPFEQLVERLQPTRYRDRSPLFQVFLALENLGVSAAHHMQLTPDLSMDFQAFNYEIAKFDLALNMSQIDGCLHGIFEYNSDLFERETVLLFVGHLLTLFQAIVRQPTSSVASLPILTSGERENFLISWNGPKRQHPLELAVHHHFETQAKRTPDAVACQFLHLPKAGKSAFESEDWTYAQINEGANKVGWHLSQQGVKPGQRVGLCGHRSPQLVTGILGILKAGAAFVPIDPEYPAARGSFVIADAELTCLLSHGAMNFALDPETCPQWGLQTLLEDSRLSRDNLHVDVDCRHPAYLMYTSGSTGQPKGVVMPHRGIANRLLWAKQRYPLKPEDRFLQTASFAFDISFWELMAPLMVGARSVIPPSKAKGDTGLLLRIITEWDISVIHFVPSVLQIFMTEAEVYRATETLRLIFCGGEALSNELRKLVLKRFKAECHHFYGPTEAAINVTAWDCREPQERVTLGRPIDNTDLYVLDHLGRLLPGHAPGQLCIAGECLARCYHRQPALTAQAFTPDPFGDGNRLYQTGDLVRRTTDGSLLFLGRLDHQVKIRGVRIEPGEIEVALLAMAGVAEAAVKAFGDSSSDIHLVAFLVPEQGLEDTTGLVASVQQAVKATFSAPMVPSQFIVLAAMPLSSNGKLDRQALERPKNQGSMVGFVPPANLEESLLAKIWADLLEVDRVGRNDDFFELGGHSLLATQVMARIRDTFETDLPVADLFDFPVLHELAALIQEDAGNELGLTITAMPRNQSLPPSFAQERMWLVSRLEGGGAVYNMPMAVRIHGSLNLPALENSVSQLVDRHESLRTCFPAVDGKPTQKILDHLAQPLRIIDLATEPEVHREQRIREWLFELANRVFDLEQGPLFEIALLKIQDELHILSVNVHHMISDGWSTGLIFSELATVYTAWALNKMAPLPGLSFQYADYAYWQRQFLQGERLEDKLTWWAEKLAQIPQRLEIHTDFPRRQTRSYRGGQYIFGLDSALMDDLVQQSKAQGLTVFMAMLAVYAAWLSRETGQRDFCIGTPVTNRELTSLRHLIGLFVNTVVLRVQTQNARGEGFCFRELTAFVRETVLDAFAHQDVPFEKVVERLRPNREAGRAAIFETMFSLEMEDGNASKTRVMQLPGLTTEAEPIDLPVAKFDFILNVTHQDEGWYGGFTFNQDLFEEATIRRFASHYQNLLRHMLADPEVAIGNIPMLSNRETQALLYDWNRSARPYPSELPVHRLFEKKAAEQPQMACVVWQDGQITYGALNQRANALALQLKQAGVCPGSVVALVAQGRPELVVALLAILKAHACYLPIDPSYPQERMAYLLKDARAHWVLVADQTTDTGGWPDVHLIQIPSVQEPPLPAENQAPMPWECGDQIAYINYTSGSTGKPKGVMVSHAAISRLVFDDRYLACDASDGIAQASNPAFDAFTFEVWTALLRGCRLCLIDRDTLIDPKSFVQSLTALNVTLLFTTTALFNQITRENPAIFARMKAVLFGGELVDSSAVRRVLAQGKPGQFLHVYGPTETTTFATWYPIEQVREDARNIPIGGPIANMRLYVLNASGSVQPVGVDGELFIGGDGLSQGYLGKPAVTARHFVPDPFSKKSGDRLYRTGDLVYRQPDGMLVFSGRIDSQVKLRGFRIELGEIEHHFRACDGVADVFVRLLGNRAEEKRLVAYLRLAKRSDGSLPEVKTIRGQLLEAVPNYMVPSHFIVLAELPLNANGKVDVRALPDPETVAAPAVGLTDPESATEQILAGIWEELLVCKPIHREANFFELGGHSLLATRMLSRIREAFEIVFPLKTLFESPSLAHLAVAIEACKHEHQEPSLPLEPACPGANRRLSFAQERLWFLDQLDPGSTAYNMPVAIRLRGVFDRAVLCKALSLLVARHEILRTLIHVHHEVPLQRVEPHQELLLPMVQIDENAEVDVWLQEQIREESSHVFSLAEGPLFYPKLCRLASDEHILILNMHHIISDGWSVKLVFRELAAIYANLAQGGDGILSPLPIQYADFSIWQRAWLRDGVLEKQCAYWERQLKDVPPHLAWNTDFPRPAIKTTRGQCLAVPLNIDWQALKNQAQQHQVTPFMWCLSAFSVLISRYANQRDFCIGTPIANRMRSQLEELIGFFANTLALRMDLSPDSQGQEPDFTEILARVRRTTLGAYAHQDIPFELIVERVKPVRDLSRSPLFQIMFSLETLGLAEEFEGVELAGLTMSLADFEVEISKFEISLNLQEHMGQLYAAVAFNSDLFEARRIRQLLGHFEELCQRFLVQTTLPVAGVPLLREAERQLLRFGWNATAWKCPDEMPLHGYIDDHAVNTPNQSAILFQDRRVDYAMIAQVSDAVAHQLITKGLVCGAPVGVFMYPSEDLPVALLAILKAGGAFLPLDPDLPEARLQFMLADSKVGMVLTLPELADRPCLTRLCRLTVAECHREVRDSQPKVTLPTLALNQPAYMMYTSGSTGKPKLVVNTHAGMLNRLLWMKETYSLGQDDRVLQKTPFTFDVSVWEHFLPLISGATLVVAEPGGHRDPIYLARLIAEKQVRIAHFVASMLGPFLDVVRPATVASLRWLISGGEALSYQLKQRCLAMGIPLHQSYGPTEASIAVAYHPCREGGHDPVPLGRPIANTQLYVVDSKNALQPVGVEGELLIGGISLSQGYLGKPCLTASQFIPDSFGQLAGGRLYRTGDVVLRLASGELVFSRRLDDQLKLRGFRIELGEIESVLRNLKDVAEVAVAIRDDHLVGYLVARAGAGEGALIAEARTKSEATLPGYMVPTKWVMVSALPLSVSGKLNRAQLPKPSQQTLAHTYVPPRNGVEQFLADTWELVLGIGNPSMDANFFDLGGHSLLATRVVAKVRTQYDVEPKLQTFFALPTIGEFARYLTQLRLKPGCALPVLEKTQTTERWPLSYAQERLWIITQFEGPSATFNMPSPLRFRGPFFVEAMQAALCELARRHQILTARIAAHQGIPYQVVYANPKIELPVVAAPGLQDDPELLQQRVDEAGLAVFDISQDALMRVQILKLADDDHVLLFTLHHIIADGWSLGIVAAELLTLYRAYTQNQPSPLEPRMLQYGDFAAWQRQWLTDQALVEQFAYWQQQLADLPTLALPTDRPRPPIQTTRAGLCLMALDAGVSEQLRRLSRHVGCSLFMTLLTAFKLCLSRYSGQEDILVGAPIAGRNREGTEDMIGFFINTLVLRTDLSGNPSFRELLSRVRQVTLAAYDHQDLPFANLVKRLGPKRDLSRNPLFQVFFNMINLPDRVSKLEALDVEPLAPPNIGSKFDLTLYVNDRHEQLVMSLHYNADLFDEGHMQAYLDQYQYLLNQIVTDVDIPIDHFCLVSPKTQALLPKQDAPLLAEQDCGILNRIASWAETDPSRPALVYANQTWSYRRLRQVSLAIADRLKASGIGQGDAVAVYAVRNPLLVSCMLGILEAEAAFVILDSKDPGARTGTLLEIAKPKGWINLVHGISLPKEVIQALDQLGVTTRLCLSLEWASSRPLDEQTVLTATAFRGPETLAYLAFTSGSTGTPKAVAGRYGPLDYMVTRFQVDFQMDGNARFTMLSALSHDPLQRDILVPLGLGARILIPHEDHIGPSALAAWFEREHITATNLTPAMSRILTHAETRVQLPTLKGIFLVGEALPKQLVLRLRHIAPNADIHNFYGTTETQRALSCFSLASKASEVGLRDITPLGKGLEGVQLWVVNRHGGLAGIGEVGEIWVRSPYLSGGYFDDPELTQARFQVNPFTQDPEDRIYKTGDLGRYLANGHVAFAGRSDHQIKIRGYRVELGEIENVLLDHPDVIDGVVVLQRRPGDRHWILAYVLPKRLGESDDLDQTCRAWLKQRLPDYMIPAAIVVLERWPLTPTGKINHRALPLPETDAMRGAKPQVAPRDGKETVLANLWTRVLGLNSVFMDDNFFELGGDSLLVMQMVSLAREQGLVFTPAQFFQNQTLAALASVAKTLQSEPPQSQIVTGLVPLTPSQAWFLDWSWAQRDVFPTTALFTIPADVDEASLRDAVRAVWHHHDALRLTFESTADGWKQSIAEPGDLVPFGMEDLSLEDRKTIGEVLPAAIARHANRLRISQGPLFKVILFKSDLMERCRLLILTHHLVADGLSFTLVVESLASAYRERRGGARPAPWVKTTSFKVWGERLLAYANSPEIAAERGYWLDPDRDKVKPLPVDFADGRVKNTLARVAVHSISLDTARTHRLYQVFPVTHDTQVKEALLTALIEAFGQWAEASTTMIAVSGHGREFMFEDVDLTRTVGWFSTISPHVFPCYGDRESAHGALKKVQAQLRANPFNGIGHGLLRYLCSDGWVRQRLASQPAAEIFFNHMGGEAVGLATRAGDFSPAPENHRVAHNYSAQRPYLFFVKSMIREGKLWVDFVYGRETHKPESVVRLADAFLTYLQMLVDASQAED